MGMSLEEYAKAHPQEVPEQPEIEETARTYHELRQERQTAEQLKNIIAGQLLTGNDPQYILYAAVQAIGILSHDENGRTIRKNYLMQLTGIYCRCLYSLTVPLLKLKS